MAKPATCEESLCLNEMAAFLFWGSISRNIESFLPILSCSSSLRMLISHAYTEVYIYIGLQSTVSPKVALNVPILAHIKAYS